MRDFGPTALDISPEIARDLQTGTSQAPGRFRSLLIGSVAALLVFAGGAGAAQTGLLGFLFVTTRHELSPEYALEVARDFKTDKARRTALMKLLDFDKEEIAAIAELAERDSPAGVDGRGHLLLRGQRVIDTLKALSTESGAVGTQARLYLQRLRER